MTKYVMVELKTTTYIKIPAEKFNEMNIESVNMEIFETNGTIHIDRADNWKIGECEFVNEED